MKLRPALERYLSSFSPVGFVLGALFFAISLTPSLLPRVNIVQGLMSGIAVAVGYGIGVLFQWLWNFLELPKPNDRVETSIKWLFIAGVLILSGVFLWRATVWQNSIRQLMEMDSVATAYPIRVTAIAIVFGALLIAMARCLGWFFRLVDKRVSRFLPRRVSYVLTTMIVVYLLIVVINGVFARTLLRIADSAFLQIDKVVEEGIPQPTNPLASGSEESLILWDSIGRKGKRFIVADPTVEQLREFSDDDALRPLRIYVGLRSKDSPEERAQLALDELKRVGGFKRSVLVVATPTGTGWLDPGAVHTLEFLHGGDTAIVTMQYSYLPSWLTILVDPNRSRVAAEALFDKIYGYWRTLPTKERPALYLHGLSLGALGSESCADLFTLFQDPIQGALWSGPPFPSTKWSAVSHDRNADSPIWLPTFRDGSMLRFTGLKNSLDNAESPWGPMRFVYIQHASDPMTFFSPRLLVQRPEWLDGERGPDVSPFLDWYPIVTFLQIASDLPMATSVPTGYGHNIAPSSYIDGWVAVTAPEGWDAAEIERLKQLFAK